MGMSLTMAMLLLHSYPPEATKCLEKKREVTLRLESKIEAGIER